MHKQTPLLVAGAALALLAMNRPAAATVASGPGTFDDLYQKYGAQFGVDWRLLRAVAIVESSERADASSGTSFGLMQVLCDADGPEGRCRNKLNISGWPPVLSDLYDPSVNVFYAAQILAWNISRYGLWRGVACYNAWAAHSAPADGPFPNQEYVDRVQAAYASVP